MSVLLATRQKGRVRDETAMALVSVVATAYLLGGEHPPVEGLVQTRGIETLSRSQVRDRARDGDAEVAARDRPLDVGLTPTRGSTRWWWRSARTAAAWSPAA